MTNNNEELILEALPHEEYIKMMQNDPSSIERILLKYLQDCRQGRSRVEAYEEYLARQIDYLYYDNFFSSYLDELTIKDCWVVIDDLKIMIREDKEFLKKNQYYLKSFPIYEKMKRNYYDSKDYFLRIFIPNLLKQIEKIKKSGA